MLSAVPKYTHPTVRWAVPTYSKCGDLLSASDYCDSLARYQKALGLDDQEVLGHVVAIALTDTATRWYRFPDTVQQPSRSSARPSCTNF